MYRKMTIIHKPWLILSLILLLMLPWYEPAPAAAAAKDTLVVALRGEPEDGFDPLMGWGRYGHPLFHSTLLTRDDELNIVNDLAVSRVMSADGLAWTITIRSDVTFSDGRPLTAEDVAFTFNQAATKGGKADLSRLERAVATAPDTVELRLKRPDSTFINRLITLGIVPRHAYDDDYDRHPVGSGPFELVSWVEGEQLIVRRNARYYGRQPYFKKIVFLYGSEDAMFAAAKAGQVDLVVVPPYLGIQKIRGMHVHPVKSVDHRGLMFPTIADTGRRTPQGAPIGNTVTADIAIRKAVNRAIDRKALVAGILEGFGRPAYFACDALPWDNPENRIADADPQGARQLLSEAGWKDGDNDGVLEKKGVKAQFNLVYPAGDSVRQGLCLAVAEMLRPVGIRALVEGKSWDEIKRRTHQDVIIYGWGSHDPLALYHIHHSSLMGQDYYNPGFYHNPKVDDYLDLAVGAETKDASLRYWQLAQWDGTTGCGPKGDAPWAWLVDLDHVYFVSDRLDVGQSRIEPHGTGWPITANILDWRIRE
ncbi:peptide ABC transporter, periplasmic peptide-binding protein [Desulfosarcina variabilis str. Montpellier]